MLENRLRKSSSRPIADSHEKLKIEALLYVLPLFPWMRIGSMLGHCSGLKCWSACKQRGLLNRTCSFPRTFGAHPGLPDNHQIATADISWKDALQSVKLSRPEGPQIQPWLRIWEYWGLNQIYRKPFWASRSQRASWILAETLTPEAWHGRAMLRAMRPTLHAGALATANCSEQFLSTSKGPYTLYTLNP